MTPLRIREAQLRVLREAALLHAVEAGLLRHFPSQCAALGRRGLGRFVAASRDRARAFGFTTVEIQGFASFELVFGESYWDTRPYLWAKRILEDKGIEHPANRFQALREASIFFLAKQAEREALAYASTDETPIEAQIADK